MIILFTYFYTAITINPTQMAEDMKRIMVSSLVLNRERNSRVY
jgi:hypothetical protein